MGEKRIHLRWKTPLVQRTVMFETDMDTLLHHEAAVTHKSVSKVINDWLRAQLAIKRQLATAIEANGDPEHGGIAHILLEKHTQTIGRSIDTHTAQIIALRGQIEVLTAMLDRAVYAYLLHTPVVNEKDRADALAAATRRYEKWQGEVKELIATRRRT